MKMFELLSKLGDKFIDISKFSNIIHDLEVSSINFDSRRIKQGHLFIALEGSKTNGHDHVRSAFDNGASYCMINEKAESTVKSQIHESFHNRLIMVKNTRESMPILAKTFYGDPDEKMKIIGITGTKGKTTTTYIIKNVLESAGYKVGIIGTINIMIGEDKISSGSTTPTTPESLDLYRILQMMYSDGVDYVVMEVSSHALYLHRVDFLQLDSAIFTNFSQDHLLLHKTMENYFNEKLKIFDLLKNSKKKDKVAVINRDMKEFDTIKKYVDDRGLKYLSCGFSGKSDIFAKNYNDININNSDFEISIKGDESRENFHVRSSLVGNFNVYNILCSVSVLQHFKVDIKSIYNGLENVSVPGRLEKISVKKNSLVVIDYAHTDDSLSNVLITLKELNPKKLITVFGCGGDRDALKRPLMGDVATDHSDFVIVTSDNPRTEDPKLIIKDILKGIDKSKLGKVKTIEDRREAIRHGLDILGDGDILLIAGKGHEDYQILGEEKVHFSDKEEVLNYIKDK